MREINLCLFCFIFFHYCPLIGMTEQKSLGLETSTLSLTVHPEYPKELLTPLQLTCTFKGQQPRDRNNDYVPFYMTVLNDRQTLLASISKYRPAEAKYEKDKLQVEGRLSSNSSDSKTSYLKLSWKRSRLDLQGNYTCTAHARNGDDMETMFTTTASVSIQKPSSEEVMTFLNNEAAIVDNIYDKIEKYYREQVKMSENIQNLTALTDNRFSETESKLNSLAVSTARHVETAEVRCEQSRFNQADAYHKYLVAPIVFKRPFITPPIVVYSVRHADIDKGRNTRYFAYTKEITNQGFKLVCGTYGDTHIYLIHVIWHAFN